MAAVKQILYRGLVTYEATLPQVPAFVFVFTGMVTTKAY